jgi:hypothetical protein
LEGPPLLKIEEKGIIRRLQNDDVIFSKYSKLRIHLERKINKQY